MTELPTSQTTPTHLDGDEAFSAHISDQARWLAGKMLAMTRATRDNPVLGDGLTMALAVSWAEHSGTTWELKLSRNPDNDDDEDDEFLAGLDDGEGDD